MQNRLNKHFLKGGGAEEEKLDFNSEEKTTEIFNELLADDIVSKNELLYSYIVKGFKFQNLNEIELLSDVILNYIEKYNDTNILCDDDKLCTRRGSLKLYPVDESSKLALLLNKFEKKKIILMLLKEHSKILEMEKDKKRLIFNKEKIETDIKKLNEKIEQFLSKQNPNQDNEIKLLNSKISNIQNEKTQLDQELASIKTTKQNFEKKISNQETEISQLKNKIEELQQIIQKNRYSVSNEVSNEVSNKVSNEVDLVQLDEENKKLREAIDILNLQLNNQKIQLHNSLQFVNEASARDKHQEIFILIHTIIKNIVKLTEKKSVKIDDLVSYFQNSMISRQILLNIVSNSKELKLGKKKNVKLIRK